MTTREVRLQAPSRIHIGLLSLHEAAPRVNGGIGFAVEGPSARIVASEDAKFTVTDERPLPMEPQELRQLAGILEQFAVKKALKTNAHIAIRGGMRTHVGMGSATAIRLGALEALSVLNQFEVSPDELIASSGRGGTSGVGVNTYFAGGLICDLGRTPDGRPFAPSSRTSRSGRPLSLPRVEMPQWPLAVCVPRLIVPKTQAQEVEFFKRTTPIPAVASYEASYIALFQIYAAAVEKDYAAFCRGICQMQSTVWKGAERAEYGVALRDLAAKLQDAGADCVGMSSLGPMLFCFAEPSRLPTLMQAAAASNCDVYQTIPTNVGRSVTLAAHA